MAYILLVEDEPLSQDMIADMMEAYGHEIDSASDGEECFAILEKCKPDIILLDMSLPDMSGEEVFHKLRNNAKTKDIPIIGLSGSTMAKKKLIEAGINGFLEKPVKIKEELLPIIAKWSK